VFGIETPPVLLDDSSLKEVASQRYMYLDVVFDSDLHWSSHVSALCRKIAYYLYLISYHQRNLPVAILKLLVLSHLHYAGGHL